MKKITIAFAIALLSPTIAFSHSGGLDKNGGHECSDKSKEKGLCSGYHYHRADAVAFKEKSTVNGSKLVQKAPN